MLARQDKGQTGAATTDLRGAFARQLSQVRELLARQSHVRLLQVAHADVIADPPRTSARIAAFIGRNLDVDAMAAAVDAGLYRARKAPAECGVSASS
jgi:hypothetical protein